MMICASLETLLQWSRCGAGSCVSNRYPAVSRVEDRTGDTGLRAAGLHSAGICANLSVSLLRVLHESHLVYSHYHGTFVIVI